MKKFLIFKIIIISSFFFIHSENIYENFEYHKDDSNYEDSDRDDNNKNLNFCKNEGPLEEYIYYIYEKTHNFDTWVNKDNAHYLVEMARNWNCYKNQTKNSGERSNCKKEYNSAYYKYLGRLGPYFFFVAFAGVVFFTWILLWFCMIYPQCCCKERENERWFKYFSFIIVLVCLAGMFACIISSFVYSHRWNNRLNGITCAIERLYYNMYYGQKNYRKGSWRGFNGLYYILDNKQNKINFKIKENNFIEDKKNFGLLEEKENLIRKNKKDISNLFINTVVNEVDEGEITILSNSESSSSSNSEISSSSSNTNSEISSLSSNTNSEISSSLSNTNSEISSSSSNTNSEISSSSSSSNSEISSSSSSSNSETTNYDKDSEHDSSDDVNIEEHKLDTIKVLKLANSFRKLKPKLFNSYHKVKRTLKGLGYYSYFVIYSVLFVIVTLIVLPFVFFVFCPTTMCKRYNSIILIVGWNCIMLFTLYSFCLTAFLGMVDYASTDMIGFFNSYFNPKNLLYKIYGEDKPFLVPEKLVGEILSFCLYGDKKEESMLDHEFIYLDDNNIENSDLSNYYKYIYYNRYINLNIDKNKNDDNEEFNNNKEMLIKKLRYLGQIQDPDWHDDWPEIDNTKCSYLINDINMLYTSFYSFSKMDRNLVAITATISYLGYVCAIFMVFTIKKFESYWAEQGKYNYGEDNDNDNNSSDSSDNDNKVKKKNKKIGNYIKFDENLKKNLINTTTKHKKKKSLDKNSNKEEENEEEE